METKTESIVKCKGDVNIEERKSVFSNEKLEEIYWTTVSDDLWSEENIIDHEKFESLKKTLIEHMLEVPRRLPALDRECNLSDGTMFKIIFNHEFIVVPELHTRH